MPQIVTDEEHVRILDLARPSHSAG